MKTLTNDAGEITSTTIDETLAERGNRYGTFSKHASLSVSLKFLIMNHMEKHNPIAHDELPAYAEEAICMICHKLARIANGDPTYDDSWRDIAGYAQLVVDNLNGKDT